MVFKALSTVKIKMEVKPTVDNLVFRLHYRYTYTIFITCVLLTTLYDAIGNQIDCMTTIDDDQFNDVVNSYCFIMGTFTVDRHHSRVLGVEVPHPGVGPVLKDDEITYHSYYQWVPFVLLIQGVLFYVPHWIWKWFEGGMFRNIIQNLSVRDYLGKTDEKFNYLSREYQFSALSKYIEHQMGSQRSWAMKFFFCEALNLVVSLGMVYFTNTFLGGEFINYGANVVDVLSQDPENRTDPMSFVFPKMAKCTFKSFGASGTIQIRDVMCLIATNIINEKIFVFLWFWLIILTTVTSLWLLLRILTIFLPPLRHHILLMYVNRHAKAALATILSRHPSVSEWLLFLNFGRNMDTGIFSEFLIHFARDLDQEVVHRTDTLKISDVSKKKLLA